MRIHPLYTELERPRHFTYPFYYEPHPLCLLAADELKRELQSMALTEGKMFGVLVVETADGGLAFLAAYSGLLNGRNDWPYFVPPVFDAQQPDGHFKTEERAISAMQADDQHEERRQRSQALQSWLFRQYRFLNAKGDVKDLTEVWRDYHVSERIRHRYPLPPGGTGDCCAPKLLQYAYSQGLRPVCMAEFWWGPSPRGEVRHHGQFYPACRGKCKPILTWMLQGLDVDTNPETLGFPPLKLETVYEDAAMAVVNKPSGMLSIPGREENYSVSTVVADRWPGAMLVHRLDMWTSGLMVVGKTKESYLQLQEQFVKRTVRKRYVALLDGIPAASSGTIRLPLLCDPMNRPRQVVDYQRGKTAITEYEVLQTYAGSDGGRGRSLVALYPHTGRTHQLRVHCAYEDGLGCPILGDELYGSKDSADRLCLHAELIELNHPQTGERLRFELPHPFGNLATTINK